MNFGQYFLKNLAIAAAVVGILTIAAPAASAFNTVIIDAGHGGHDRGADHSLVYEKHLNLDVARRLERALTGLGYKVVMIRRDDRFVPLDKRAAIANRYRNAVFVSIHFNSSWKGQVTGIETFYKSATGRTLATHIQGELMRSIRTENRGVKTANFVVLKKTRHPAVLVEGGFVSNRTERNAMMDPRYRQAVVDGIVRGLMKYDRRR
ncbi:MAG: N-acetylmuramoyl-L-alanine amidase [Verrucomicrobiales bacterium]|nr:N-acetylmuramoyl-L-alanine amidase [Verrucomicrobiales bacterium]